MKINIKFFKQHQKALNKLHKDHPGNKKKSGKKITPALFDGDIAEPFATSKELKKGLKKQLKRAFAEMEMEEDF